MGHLEYQIKRTKLRIEHTLQIIFLMLYNIITTTYMKKDIGMFADFTQLYTT